MARKGLTRFDDEYRSRWGELLAGIDEAGRGPLAGPVVAACVALPAGVKIRGVRDSKEMTAAEREDAMNGTTGRFAVLTPREIEIARLIGQGASNKRIARQLSITERTVKAHLTMIFRKTGVDDRVKLALMVSRRH